MIRQLILFGLMIGGFHAAESQRSFNIVTLKNDLDRPLEIEIKQENLEAKVTKPVIGDKGKVELVPLNNNIVVVNPKNVVTIQMRARGDAMRGQVIAHVVADKRITIFGYEVEEPSKRTKDSEKSPAICQIDKPGTDDVQLKITTGRLAPLACKPLNPKVL